MRETLSKRVFGLPVAYRERWEDGSTVIYLESPFPFALKPFVPSRLAANAKKASVQLTRLHGTQHHVTSCGVGKYLFEKPDTPPLVYSYAGELFIVDGHHRLTAASLRGDKTAGVLLVKVPVRSNPARRGFSRIEAKAIGTSLGLDWKKFNVDQFRRGLNVELEHGRVDPHTDVTHDDAITTGKIALAHLNEFPDYYDRLAKMEREASRRL